MRMHFDLEGRAGKASRWIMTSATCAVLALSLPTARCVGQAIHLPTVTRVTLPNGIRVVLMEYHKAPTITVNAQFPGGAASDPSGRAGAAGLTADLMRKGTDAHTAQQLAEATDFLGGSLGAQAGEDRLTVSLDVQSKDTDAGLDLFTEIILRPTFPAEELERERKLSLDALESLGEDPGGVAARVAHETVFAGHPYGAESTVTSLKAITREDLEAFYKRFIVPDRMILVAVGDFRTAEMLAKLKQRFSDWPHAGAESASIPAVNPGARKLVLIDKPDATQTQARWIRTGFDRKSPDYVAAQVANSILGGGFTSRLIEEIRINKSLTYGIGSGFSAHLHGGTFGVSTFTKIETTRPLIVSTDEVLKRSALQGLTEAELHKVKGFMAGLFAISMQTPEALAGELGDIAFFGLPETYLQTYIPRLQAVTLPEANRIARTYFDPSKMSLVLVAPASKVQSQLQGLGSFEVRSVTTVGK